MDDLRVIAVDDEPLALERITSLLAESDGIEVVASLTSGSAAIAAIRDHRPHIVLLDIEMPKIDGFDVVEAIASFPAKDAPLVIFVTAFPQFAVQAFETGALDYLSKPVRRARLELTLGRARQAIDQREAAERLAALRANLGELRDATADAGDRTLWMRQRGEILGIAASDIEWIQSEGQYVRLHQRSRSHLMRASIGSILEQLPEGHFVQIHRSSVVNRSNVAAVKATRQGTSVELKSGQKLAVGRKFKKAVLDIVGSQVR